MKHANGLENRGHRDIPRSDDKTKRLNSGINGTPQLLDPGLLPFWPDFA